MFRASYLGLLTRAGVVGAGSAGAGSVGGSGSAGGVGSAGAGSAGGAGVVASPPPFCGQRDESAASSCWVYSCPSGAVQVGLSASTPVAPIDATTAADDRPAIQVSDRRCRWK